MKEIVDLTIRPVADSLHDFSTQEIKLKKGRLFLFLKKYNFMKRITFNRQHTTRPIRTSINVG